MRRPLDTRNATGGRRRRAWLPGVRPAAFAAFGGLLVGLLGASGAAAQGGYPWPEVRLTEPVAGELTVVSHYNFRERRYEPPVAVEDLPEEPETYVGPEEVVAGLVSAMRAQDHDWWLATWDEGSRELIERRDEAAGSGAEERLERWAERAGEGEPVFVRWVETGQHVIVVYRRRDAEGELAGDEQRVATKITDRGWRATLELVDDPVFRHVTRLDEVEEPIERTVRPSREPGP